MTDYPRLFELAGLWRDDEEEIEPDLSEIARLTLVFAEVHGWRATGELQREILPLVARRHTEAELADIWEANGLPWPITGARDLTRERVMSSLYRALGPAQTGPPRPVTSRASTDPRGAEDWTELRRLALDLHQDWDLEHADPVDFVRDVVRYNDPDLVEALIVELETVAHDGRTEDELEDWWVDELGSAFDPASVDMTHRQWFHHMLDVLRSSTS